MSASPVHIATLLKLQNSQRIWNSFKNIISYYFSRIFRLPFVWGNPLAVSVEPANFCNLSCPQCPVGMMKLTRDVGQMRLEVFTQIIDELAPKTSYLTLYLQGEPFLNKDFFEMATFAVSKKMYVTTSTNGQFLSAENAQKIIDSGLQSLIVSIDGTTQEVYEKYRIGGELKKAIDGVKNVVRLRQKFPKVFIQFLVTGENEHQISDLYRLANETGADGVLLKTAQIYDFENGSNLIPSNPKWSRYKKGRDGKFVIKNRLMNHCQRIWNTAVFSWDGVLIACCFDKDSTYRFGKIGEKPFKKIWKSHEMNDFRKSVLRNRKGIDICQNCTEGTKIWI